MWPLLILCVATAVAESQTIQKFGCSFVDDVTYQDPDTNSDIYIAKYGAEVDPMKFNSVSALQELIAKIQSIYSSTLENYLFNTFPIFTEFYLARNRSREGNIEDFFNKYNVEVKDNILSITLLNIITHKYPDVEKHCYLVGVSERKDTPSTDDLKKTSPLFQDLAAAIRISVNTRKGVILMDIDNGFYGPVVIMEDGKAPHLYISRTSREYPECCYSKPSVDIKGLRSRMRGNSGEHYQFKLHEDHSTVIAEKDDYKIFYIDRPFCSISNLLKLKLIESQRTMERRNKYGHNVVTITYEFLDERENPSPTFKIDPADYIKYNCSNILKWSPFTLKCQDPQTRVERPQHKIMTDAMKEMKYDEVGTILNLSDEIAKNKEFLEEYEELRKIVKRHIESHA